MTEYPKLKRLAVLYDAAKSLAQPQNLAVPKTRLGLVQEYVVRPRSTNLHNTTSVEANVLLAGIFFNYMYRCVKNYM